MTERLANARQKMNSLFRRWRFWWASRGLRSQWKAFEEKMRFSDNEKVRLFYAKISPGISRYRADFKKAMLLEEPQRAKFLLHLAAHWDSLANYYPLLFERVCDLNLPPFTLEMKTQFKTDTTLRVRKNHLLLDELIRAYNEKYQSRYRAQDFLNLPMPGVKDLIAFSQDYLDHLPSKVGVIETVETFETAQFVIEYVTLWTEIQVAAIGLSDVFGDALWNLDGMLTVMGISFSTDGYFGVFDLTDDEMSKVGRKTLAALSRIVETAFERAV